MALIVDDSAAPTDKPFVHRLVWSIPTDVQDIPEAIPREATVEALGGAAQGTNDFGQLGYSGPCPRLAMALNPTSSRYSCSI